MVDETLPIRFFDYDGTLLYSYSLETLQEMTELPPLPSQEGLICEGWNWTLEDLKATNREMNVSVTYITDDGATRVYVSIDEYTLEPRILFDQSDAEAVKIDWEMEVHWKLLRKQKQQDFIILMKNQGSM